jgi:hypothetical protein
MKLNQLFIAGLVVMLFAGSHVFACSCAGTRPSCQEYWEATAVFSGTVIESRQVTVNEGTYSHEMRAVRISLDQAFRGVEGQRLKCSPGSAAAIVASGSDKRGSTWVYANRSSGTKNFTRAFVPARDYWPMPKPISRTSVAWRRPSPAAPLAAKLQSICVTQTAHWRINHCPG